MKTITDTRQADLSQQISLLNLGINDVAYVRPLMTPNGRGFGVYAANGEQYALADSVASAYGFIREHELRPVSLN